MSCGNNRNENAKTEVLQFLDSAVAKKRDAFQLSEIKLDVNWDSLIILEPYTVVERMGYSKNIDVEVLKETRIEFRDDICVLAFLNGHQIACYAEINMGYDFSQASHDKIYSKNQHFHLSKDPRSKIRYLIKEE